MALGIERGGQPPGGIVRVVIDATVRVGFREILADDVPLPSGHVANRIGEFLQSPAEAPFVLGEAVQGIASPLELPPRVVAVFRLLALTVIPLHQVKKPVFVTLAGAVWIGGLLQPVEGIVLVGHGVPVLAGRAGNTVQGIVSEPGGRAAIRNHTQRFGIACRRRVFLISDGSDLPEMIGRSGHLAAGIVSERRDISRRILDMERTQSGVKVHHLREGFIPGTHLLHHFFYRAAGRIVFNRGFTANRIDELAGQSPGIVLSPRDLDLPVRHAGGGGDGFVRSSRGGERRLIRILEERHVHERLADRLQHAGDDVRAVLAVQPVVLGSLRIVPLEEIHSLLVPEIGDAGAVPARGNAHLRVHCFGRAQCVGSHDVAGTIDPQVGEFIAALVAHVVGDGQAADVAGKDRFKFGPSIGGEQIGDITRFTVIEFGLNPDGVGDGGKVSREIVFQTGHATVRVGHRGDAVRVFRVSV